MRVKTEEKRQLIIATARETFRKKGFAGTSMAEIAASLGGSKGTLYNYFISKEELFAAVVVAMAKSHGEPLVGELKQARDVNTALRTFARKLVRRFCSSEFVDFRRMHIAEGGRSGLGKLLYEKGLKLPIQGLADVLAVQMRANHLRDADPWQAALHLLGLLRVGLVDNLLEGVIDHASDEEIVSTADAAVDVFLRAYATTPPGRGRARMRPKRRPQ
ncbi:MAG TPA: TetR/AcrR family transcriptional regulator [Steroidobacteraceae bacterium]|nr:TetR/AcrR family transcriptional regulator [Steroidobacteraceae bacterium]